MVQERENVEDIIGHFVIHLWDDSIIWFKCNLILQSDGTLNGSKIFFLMSFVIVDVIYLFWVAAILKAKG